MARREWGVRDRRTGQVLRAVDFEAAQYAVNADSGRCELMVRWSRGEWVSVEWLAQDIRLAAITPPPPAAGRRVGAEEWLGVRGSQKAIYRLYEAVRGLIFGEQGLFRKHNG